MKVWIWTFFAVVSMPNRFSSVNMNAWCCRYVSVYVTSGTFPTYQLKTGNFCPGSLMLIETSRAGQPSIIFKLCGRDRHRIRKFLNELAIATKNVTRVTCAPPWSWWKQKWYGLRSFYRFMHTRIQPVSVGLWELWFSNLRKNGLWPLARAGHDVLLRSFRGFGQPFLQQWFPLEAER